MAEQKREKPFKPEVNVPVWLQFIPHVTYGINPLEQDHPDKEIPNTVMGKPPIKIPAHKDWMFGVVHPESGVGTVWFCQREAAMHVVMDMTQQEMAAGREPIVGMMQFQDDRKYYLCLYAESVGVVCLPDHDVPKRFLDFCGVGAERIVAVAPPTPAAPAKPVAAPSGRPEAPHPGTEAQPPEFDWSDTRIRMQMALDLSADIWRDELDRAYDRKEGAKDLPETTKTTAFYAAIKEAAVRGISTTASSLFIEASGGHNGRRK